MKRTAIGINNDDDVDKINVNVAGLVFPMRSTFCDLSKESDADL